MKKLLLTIPLFFILPISSFAYITLDNTTYAQGTIINFSALNTSGYNAFINIFNADTGVSIDIVQYQNAGNWPTNYLAYNTTSLSAGGYNVVNTINSNCTGLNFTQCMESGQYQGNSSFTITPPPPTQRAGGVLFGTHYVSSGSDDIGTSTTGLMAAVGAVSTNAFNGIFPYLLLSAGVFLGFYIIQQIAMFFGSMSKEKVRVDKEQANWSGKGKMEHEVSEFKKKRRSRIKRGLE